MTASNDLLLNKAAHSQEFLVESFARGAEGLMLKQLDFGGYQPSKRSESWLKVRRQRPPRARGYCLLLRADAADRDNRRRFLLPLTRPLALLSRLPQVKKDYCEGLRDSLDLVPIGAWHGNGRKVGRQRL